MRPVSISLRCSWFFSIFTALTAFAFSGDAHGFGKAPYHFFDPMVRAEGIQGNNLYVQFWNIPWCLQKNGLGAGNWEVVLEASNPRTNKWAHTDARIGSGSGVVVVRIPPNVAPDTYRVLVFDKNTGRSSATSQPFEYEPLLDSQDDSRLVFDTGVGKSAEDSKTSYREYRNTWQLTAAKDVGIGFVIPSLWGCSGQCLLDMRFYDSRGNHLGGFLGAQIVPVGGTHGSVVALKRKIELRAGDQIRVEMKLVSTGGAGMHSTGPLGKPKKSGVFTYELLGTSQQARGGMAFQLWDIR